MTFLAVSLALVACVVAWLWLRERAAVGALRRVLAATQRTADGLRAESERLQQALDKVPDGLLVLDAEGGIVVANSAAAALAELPAGPLAGRRLVDLVTWPPLPQALRGAAGRVQFELLPSADGRLLVVRVDALPDRGFLVVIDDQSRLRRLESLRRDFVANVSHELKTPLAAIQGFVETMQDDQAMPEATRVRFLERIARQTERLTTLVGDLLTLSRLDDESGAGDTVDPCELGNVVRETLRDLQPLADKRQQQLAATLPDDAVWVRAEREALRQVVGNLIDNAIKYTPPGGAVRVALALVGDRARCEVTDTGIGLSAADQERIFERFYRVDRARSRDLGGTGLGLSIVKNTIKALGGEVGVASQLGQGSTFWVELPRADASPDRVP
jgi:two-component system, OmpR family, phosphate regulon sensor histidine kinase PhoR